MLLLLLVQLLMLLLGKNAGAGAAHVVAALVGGRDAANASIALDRSDVIAVDNYIYFLLPRVPGQRTNSFSMLNPGVRGP